MKIEEQIKDILEDFEGDRFEEGVFISTRAYPVAIGRILSLLTKEHNDGYLLGLKEGTELNVTQSPQSETLHKECITSDTKELTEEKKIEEIKKEFEEKFTEVYEDIEDWVAYDSNDVWNFFEPYLTKSNEEAVRELCQKSLSGKHIFMNTPHTYKGYPQCIACGTVDDLTQQSLIKGDKDE